MTELPILARSLVLVGIGLALLSICYLALGQAQARAEAVGDRQCFERTVDGGLFEQRLRGVPALVCATEAPRSRSGPPAVADPPILPRTD